jgi:archaemetzincin
MKPIRVIPLATVDPALTESVRGALAREYATHVSVASASLDASFAYHPERQQYHSTEMVEHLASTFGDGNILLGLTSVDLYIPILTFVFGEAHLDGHCAVVSYHRLRQEFYGLPADPELLEERIVKEAIHEVGHTLGLHHCEDYECVMASSHAVEWLDMKYREICDHCRQLAGLGQRWVVARIAEPR